MRIRSGVLRTNGEAVFSGRLLVDFAALYAPFNIKEVKQYYKLIKTANKYQLFIRLVYIWGHVLSVGKNLHVVSVLHLILIL